MKFRYQKIPHHGHDSRQPLVSRPYIPVYLHGKDRSTPSPYYALLDSGADQIMFPADLAEQVGIADIATGIPDQAIGIAGQRTDIYFHKLELEVTGDSRRLSVLAGFSSNIFIPILGRTFFSHYQSVIFHEDKEEVELQV
mgnify:CR=1 FL=1